MRLTVSLLASLAASIRANGFGRIAVIVVVLGCINSLITVAGAQEQYTYKLIDFPDGNVTAAYSIDDRGQIVGGLGTNLQETSGFFYQSGKFTPLNFPGDVDTRPRAVAGNGMVVGNYVGDDSFAHAFTVTRKGNFKAYDTIDCPDAVSAEATAINNNGEIAGHCIEELGPNEFFSRGFLLRGGVYTTVNFPGAAPTGIPGMASGTILRGISDSGTIVGIAIESDTSQQAYFTSDFGVTFTPFDCPTGYDPTPTIEAMSSDGKVAGNCFHLVTGPHDFVYENGTFTFINDIPGQGTGDLHGINSKGQIVGHFCEFVDNVCVSIRSFIGTPVKVKK